MRTVVLGCLTALVAASQTAAQTIQLPSFHAVGVNTTVVVPDSGGAFVSRDWKSYQSLSTFGRFPPNRGWGIRRRMPGVSITARIHDPATADAALGGKSFAAGAPAGDRPPGLRIGAGRAAGDAPTGSVAELQQRRAQQAARDSQAAQREAMALLARGRKAAAAGKTSVAAIYLRMAARDAKGPLGERIAAELQALNAESLGTARTGRTEP